MNISEIILNLDEEMFKRFLIRSSGSPLVHRNGIIRAILEDGTCEIILNMDLWMSFKAKVYGWMPDEN